MPGYYVLATTYSLSPRSSFRSSTTRGSSRGESSPIDVDLDICEIETNRLTSEPGRADGRTDGRMCMSHIFRVYYFVGGWSREVRSAVLVADSISRVHAPLNAVVLRKEVVDFTLRLSLSLSLCLSLSLARFFSRSLSLSLSLSLSFSALPPFPGVFSFLVPPASFYSFSYRYAVLALSLWTEHVLHLPFLRRKENEKRESREGGSNIATLLRYVVRCLRTYRQGERILQVLRERVSPYSDARKTFLPVKQSIKSSSDRVYVQDGNFICRITAVESNARFIVSDSRLKLPYRSAEHQIAA